MTEQLKNHAEVGGDHASVINQAHDQRALRDREHRAFATMEDNLNTTKENLRGNIGRICCQMQATISPEMLDGSNQKIMATLRDRMEACRQDVDGLIEQAEKRIEAERQKLSALSKELSLAHKEQEIAFHDLLARHKEAQSKAFQRTRLEKLRNDLMDKEREKEHLEQQLSQLQDERYYLLDTLSDLRDQRYKLRKEVVDQINDALTPAIRVTLIQYGDPSRYRTLLEQTLKGHRLQHRQVAAKIAHALSPMELVDAINGGDHQILVDRAELNSDQADKVFSVLEGGPEVFELEGIEMDDLPVIELNDNGTYKKTSALSTGQKCTTILPILLLDSENPLLIDQPEDNLDNRFVFEHIVATIGAIKQRRQMIFVTHNPNIPVLSEADRVFVMDSDGIMARQINAGTVDECKDYIVTLLEGGADAFRRRGQRYAS